MWYLKKLEIDGLMSFGQANIDFNQGEVSVIYGKNLDAGEDKSNGSGKSAILEGIGFGITGSPLRKVKIGELVNDDSKEALVKIVLANDGLNEVMEINRIAYKRKSSVCQIFISSGESEPTLVDSLTSTDEANKYIEKKLGIVRDDLLNFFILMSAKFTPFLDASDTKKKDVINRFSNGVIVDKAIETLSTDLALCEEEFSELNISLSSFEQTLEALNSTLLEATASKSSKSDSSERISKINLVIGGIEANICKRNDDSISLNADREEILSEIDSLSDDSELEENLSNLVNEISELKDKRVGFKTDLQEIDHKIKHIKLKLDGSIMCPKCTHNFDPTDSSFSVADADEEMSLLELDREKVILKGKAVVSHINKLLEERDSIKIKIDENKSIKKDLLDELGEVEHDIKKIKTENFSDKERISLYETEIDVISNEKPQDLITPLENKISSIEDKIKPVKAKLEDVEAERDEYNVQLDVFRRFKSHLANMSLKSMESLANDFLNDFGSDIFIQLNSEKRLANNKTKEKIDSTLVRNGVDIGSFNKRSGGEKASINLAFAKTLSHLINLNAGENRGLNLLVIDEILDSSDQEGLTKIVRSLEKTGDNCILITHIPLPESVGNPITVCKENDLSRIL